jgi:hypothetical protein
MEKMNPFVYAPIGVERAKPKRKKDRSYVLITFYIALIPQPCEKQSHNVDTVADRNPTCVTGATCLEYLA